MPADLAFCFVQHLPEVFGVQLEVCGMKPPTAGTGPAASSTYLKDVYRL